MDQPKQPTRSTHARRYHRYELETELRAAAFGVDHREMRGRSLNINEGGIAGVFVAGWEVGTPVNLQFSVPITANPVRVKGVVRNSTGYRYGFEFSELTEEERETIRRTCRTLDMLQLCRRSQKVMLRQDRIIESLLPWVQPEGISS
jgi:hypothetical protein